MCVIHSSLTYHSPMKSVDALVLYCISQKHKSTPTQGMSTNLHALLQLALISVRNYFGKLRQGIQ